MSHVEEHCETPEITRHWKRLGWGAVWMCSCGQMYRLTSTYTLFSPDGCRWSWEQVKP